MRIPLHRIQTLLLGFLMLALAAGLAGCETNTVRTLEDSNTEKVEKGDVRVIRETDGPCGPMLEGDDIYRFEQVIHWTPDGAHLIFDHLGMIMVVDLEGTSLRTLVDADPRYPIGERRPWNNFPHGFYFDVSPDGTRVVYTSCEFRPEGPNVDPESENYYSYEIAVINLDGTEKQRLTRNVDSDHYPVWSPDGKRIAYWSSPAGPYSWGYRGEIFTMAADEPDVRQGEAITTPAIRKESTFYEAIVADGSEVDQGEAIPTPTQREKSYYVAIVPAPQLWSPDGEHLAFLAAYQESLLYTIRVDGTGWTRVAGPVVVDVPHLTAKNKPYWATVLPSWSPDGDVLAFVMADEESAPVGVYTARPDGTDLAQVLESQGAEWQVSQVLWSPDGSELLIASDSHYFIVERDGSNARRVELENPLDQAWRVGAWSPDGARIALYVPGNPYENIPPQLYTVARDGTDLRTLVRADADGNLVPANPPEDE